MKDKKLLIGIVAIALVGLGVFLVLRSHSSGEEYRAFTSPDGRHKVVVYRNAPSFAMPGQSGDAPGKVCLYETATGKLLQEKKVEMVQLIEQANWSPTNVDIKLFADWKL